MTLAVSVSAVHVLTTVHLEECILPIEGIMAQDFKCRICMDVIM